MKIAIGSDVNGLTLKNHLKSHLENMDYDVLNVTSNEEYDLFDAATNVSKAITDEEADRGIVIDAYGVGSSIVANKYEGIICANVADEHSAKMTVAHNNSSIITLGSEIIGEILAAKICEAFVKADYDGGRHQIRVDMVNKMC
ncbi:galactose-6-phosphate isomerase subunit LacA [Lentibacillus sp. CBA3610]|uniref:galactose-6-phosphate isomerase subunit LacA n=1 Tax=Lentibacillus sp. CBA3610 TaxID=2518176 RepID=UPI00159597A2|nr:galactose-6-phosphate isomerase subunit LacA [Lentibacillus sp. CBA3610]QKY70362.1 galactose-6-phosphate isomerase subunit LacA [Lentibacillus sp. CBA3610]